MVGTNASVEQRQIPIDLVSSNPEQARKTFDENKLRELSDSIKQKGVLSPILVKPNGEGYQIIAGERRWRAAKMAGLQTIPAVVKDFSCIDAAAASLIENIVREDLNPIELAEGIQRLISEYNLTQEKVAEMLSMSRSNLANVLRLLGLAKPVIEMVRSGDISVGHARCLAAIPDKEEQIGIAKRAVEKRLSVREIEELAKRVKNGLNNEGLRIRPQANFSVLETWLGRIFGTKCYVSGNFKNGRVIISYQTDKELDWIHDVFKYVDVHIKEGKLKKKTNHRT